MDNFRDSYFQVDWDLTTKRLKGTYWGKQYDTGRGFAVTVINGGQVVTATNEVLRLKWEKPDNTTGYVNATIVDGKFIVENIDQMFTVYGSVRADFELSVGGEFVASITFYVNVEKAVAVDAIESSSDFTALQVAIATADSVQSQVDAVIANATVDSEVILARGTEPTLGARLDSTDEQTRVPVENVVINGSFDNGKTGWLPSDWRNEFDVIDGVAKTTNFTGTDRSFIQHLTGKVITGNKYYIRFKTKTDNVAKSRYLRIMSGTATSDGYTEYSLSEGWNTISNIITWGLKDTIRFYYNFTDVGEYPCYLDDVLLIDLTKTFGSGNEPTKEEMDNLITLLSIDSWEGNLKNIDLTMALYNMKRAKDEDVKQLETEIEVARGEYQTLGERLENATSGEENVTLGFDNLDEELSTLFVKTPTKNLFNPDTRIVDSRVNHIYGYIDSNVGYDATDFIEVEPNTDYYATYANRTAWYSQDKEFISGIYNSNHSAEVITSPANAKYVRLSISKAELDGFQIEKGNEFTGYEPYGDKVIIKGSTPSTIPTQSLLPQYLVDEIDRVALKVARIDSDLTFAFATDIHLTKWVDTTYKMRILGELGKMGILNFVGIGGDIVDGGENGVDKIKRLLGGVKYSKDSFPTDLFIAQGNHDTGFEAFSSNYDWLPTPETVVTPNDWYNLACRHIEDKVVFGGDETSSGYFYKDYDKSKVRVIVLNTADAYELDTDGNPTLNSMNVWFRQGQFEWLQNEALNFMDKGQERLNWGVLILTHAPLSKTEYGGLYGRAAIHEVLKAYMNGTSHTGTYDNGSAPDLVVNCDFTEQGQMEFICSIHGHLHWDRVTMYPDFNRPCITVANMKTGTDYKVDPVPADAIVHSPRTAGEISGESFDVFSIDRTNRKIYTTKFGAGSDRVIDY